MKPLPLKFLKSAANYDDLTDDTGGEVIMAGYSNVGKSSLINAIANTKGLAKCSKTPGRTQLFNIFTLDENKRILDLPGYGFAKVSGKKQHLWAERFSHYISIRQCLKGIVIITDIRRGLRPIDFDLIGFAHEYEIPLAIILNKADKLSKQETNKAKQALLDTINISNEHLLLCSCSKKIGIDNIITLISTWLEYR